MVVRALVLTDRLCWDSLEQGTPWHSPARPRSAPSCVTSVSALACSKSASCSRSLAETLIPLPAVATASAGPGCWPCGSCPAGDPAQGPKCAAPVPLQTGRQREKQLGGGEGIVQRVVFGVDRQPVGRGQVGQPQGGPWPPARRPGQVQPAVQRGGHAGGIQHGGVERTAPQPTHRGIQEGLV